MKITKLILAIFCVLFILVACTPRENLPSNEITSSQPTTTKQEELSVGGYENDTTPSLTTIPPTITTTQKPTTVTTTRQNAVYPAYAQKYAYAGYTPQQTNTEPWYLMLLNINYCLPEGYKVQTADAGNDTLLDKRVVPAFNDMYNAAKLAGHTLTPQSGWRSLSRQEINLNASIATWESQGYSKVDATHRALQLIMLPGCSEHNAGLAMDIVTWRPEDKFENTAAFAWLMKNAADYGFILRYPKDKTAITGVSFEPWHWRYVGVKAAKEIMAQGVTLEEYLGMT